MIKTLGPPTLFITCSTDEWFSDALLNHIQTINKDTVNIDNMTPSDVKLKFFSKSKLESKKSIKTRNLFLIVS